MNRLVATGFLVQLVRFYACTYIPIDGLNIDHILGWICLLSTLAVYRRMPSDQVCPKIATLLFVLLYHFTVNIDVNAICINSNEFKLKNRGFRFSCIAVSNEIFSVSKLNTASSFVV